MVPIRVLFVCATNSAMSAMAEGFLHRYGGAAFVAESAGVDPQPLHPLAADVMRRSGFDIATHRSRGLADIEASFDFVVTLDEPAREAAHSLRGARRLIHWRFDDPLVASGHPREVLKIFMRARDELAGRVRLFAYAQVRHRSAHHPVARPAASVLA